MILINVFWPSWSTIPGPLSEFATLETSADFTRVSTAYKQTTLSKTYNREGGGWGRSKLCNSGSDIITINGFCLDYEREEPLVSQGIYTLCLLPNMEYHSVTSLIMNTRRKFIYVLIHCVQTNIKYFQLKFLK